ncbi:MAG: sulfotransferase family protein [Planctomycetaceae bacterium]
MPNFGDWMHTTFGPGWFAGINAGDWLRLLVRERFSISPAYWPRAAFVSGLSVVTSAFQTVEDLMYKRRLRDISIQPPLFVLGHMRSGTTHLHNLLSLDHRFGHPTMFEVNFPQSYLLAERAFSWAMELTMPSSRPMDNMSVGADSPQEDEWAMVVMTQKSPYMGWSFPHSIRNYEKYWTLNDASPADREEWQESLLYFCRKLQWTHKRPLVLKSPAHTARVRWLLPIFPQARFVHVHRNPYEVFRSTQRLWQKIRPFSQLQQPRDLHLDDERIFACYREMHRQYFADRDSIPSGHLCEVRFEDLERRPLVTLQKIYEDLGLPDFSEVKPRFEEYLEQTAGYQKNKHKPLPADQIRRINSEWRESFENWGYRMDEPVEAGHPAAAGLEAEGRPAAA